MPPTRRQLSNPTPRAQQTLTFGPHANKVTKPTHPPAGKKKRSPLAPTAEKAAVELPSPAAEDELPPPPEQRQALVIREGAAEEKEKEKGKEREKGARVSEAAVKLYWKSKEDERIAPRVHQQGLDVHEKILRHFDLSSQYGVRSPTKPPQSLANNSISGVTDLTARTQPCVGIPRMRRWKRAEGLGLKPPVEVLAVLLKEEESGNGKAERAFVEGLLTSRVAGNE